MSGIKTSKLKTILALSLLASGLISCGASIKKEALSNNDSGGNNQFTPGGGGGAGPTDPGVPENFAPSITDEFTISGKKGATPSYTMADLDTDSILKVKITAGPAAQVVNGGFVSSYGCVQYTIEVLGRTVTTNVLQVPGEDHRNCPSGSSSQIIDFSERLGGYGSVDVTVKDARYDFYCNWWEYLASYGGPYYADSMLGPRSLHCPTKLAYETHNLTGTLAVQVNGALF